MFYMCMFNTHICIHIYIYVVRERGYVMRNVAEGFPRFLIFLGHILSQSLKITVHI